MKESIEKNDEISRVTYIIGVPGAGKSTIFNNLMIDQTEGKIISESGVASKPSGLTQDLIEYPYINKDGERELVVDIPGFNMQYQDEIMDIQNILLEERFKRINEHMKKYYECNFQIIFVMYPCSGRLNPSELILLSMILFKFKAPKGIGYKFMINQLSLRWINDNGFDWDCYNRCAKETFLNLTSKKYEKPIFTSSNTLLIGYYKDMAWRNNKLFPAEVRTMLKEHMEKRVEPWDISVNHLEEKSETDTEMEKLKIIYTLHESDLLEKILDYIYTFDIPMSKNTIKMMFYIISHSDDFEERVEEEETTTFEEEKRTSISQSSSLSNKPQGKNIKPHSNTSLGFLATPTQGKEIQDIDPVIPPYNSPTNN